MNTCKKRVSIYGLEKQKKNTMSRKCDKHGQKSNTIQCKQIFGPIEEFLSSPYFAILWDPGILRSTLAIWHWPITVAGYRVLAKQGVCKTVSLDCFTEIN